MALPLKLESFVRPPADRLRGRQAPCELRLQRHREVLAEIAKQKGEKAYYRALGELAQKDYWLFLRDVLLFEWMDPWFHGEEVCTFLAKTEGQTRTVLMPRGSGKSGMITIPMPVWRLARDPMARIMVSNATETRANKFLRATASIITSMPRFQKCYPYLKASAKWGEGGYYLDIGAFDPSLASVERGDPSLAAFGVTSNVTGSHVNGESFLDDLINKEMARSPEQRKLAEGFFIESLNCVDPGTTVTVCGTRWTYDDFYGKLVNGELAGKSGGSHVLKLGVTRKDEHGSLQIIWPQKTYIDLATKASRTVGYTWEDIKALKKNLGSLFSALYMNEPVQDEDQKFDLQLIKKYKQLPFNTGRLASAYIEIESQARALYDGIRKVMTQEGRVFRLEPITSRKASKRERILSNIQPVIADCRFNMPERLWTDGGNNLGEELRTYDKGSDDCLDALAYCIALAREAKGEPPRVFITIDPAFSVESYSDHTAIVAGCVFEGEFWLLDCFRFQTDRIDVMARQLFRMIDKYHAKSTVSPQKFDMKLEGHKSNGHSASAQQYYVSGDEPEVLFESPYYIPGDRRNGTR